MEVGVLALATLLQASCNVSDRDAVELTVMEKRWQLVLACLGAAQPPFSQSTLCNFRMRLIAPDLDQRLLEQTVALAEQTGGFGARQLRAALDSPPPVRSARMTRRLIFWRTSAMSASLGGSPLIKRGLRPASVRSR